MPARNSEDSVTSDSELQAQQFGESVETLRQELIRAFGSPDAIPSTLKEAYLAAVLTGLALADHAARDSVDGVASVRTLKAVRVLRS